MTFYSIIFSLFSLQCTVAGQIGANGPLVVHPVELVFKNAPGPVRSLIQVMAGNLVKEQPMRHKNATGSPALVRTKMFLSASRFFFFYFLAPCRFLLFFRHSPFLRKYKSYDNEACRIDSTTEGASFEVRNGK